MVAYGLLGVVFAEPPCRRYKISNPERKIHYRNSTIVTQGSLAPF